MSLYGSGVGLIDRCTILRDQSGPDAWGQPEGVFTAVASDVPCRIVPATGAKQANKADLVTEVLGYAIAFTLDTDVQKGDRIEAPDIFSGSVTVVLGQAYRDHLEVTAEATS